MSIDSMLELVNQYKEAAQLKAELAARGTDTLQVGCHKVKLSDFTSTRLDSKAIKAIAPALFEQYSKTFTVQRLSIN